VKHSWVNLVRLIVSAAALALLFATISLEETLSALRQADLRYLLAALALYSAGLFVRSWRWWILIRELDPSVAYRRLVRLYYIGQFFSIFLPSAIGGDAVRALELTQDTDSSAAVGTVLLDRLTGLIVLFAVGLAALPFEAARLDSLLLIVLGGVMAGGLVVGALILEAGLLRRITRRLPGALSLSGEGTLARVYAAVTGCGWPAVRTALVVSLGYNVVNVVIFWLCAQAVGAGLGLGYLLAVTPLVGVAGLLPSIGGWGVRELVSTAVFSPAGTGPNVAAAIGVAVGLVALGAGLVGGALYLFGAARGLLGGGARR
jgi:uncharacterized membrane protein YbhN (UPF0104 family)